MELDEELRTFAAHKAELLARHRGEVALVKEVEVIGILSHSRPPARHSGRVRASGAWREQGSRGSA